MPTSSRSTDRPRRRWLVLAPLALLALVAPLVVLGPGCGDGNDTPRSPRDVEADEWASAVSHIIVKAENPKDAPDAHRKVFEIHDRLVAGEDFGTLARALSEDAAAKDGGFLGFVPTFHRSRFAGVAAALPIGATSRPFRTQAGYQIVHRHSFEDARRIEQETRIPIYGFFLPWRGLPGGQLEKDAASAAIEQAYKDIVAGRTTITEARLALAPPGPNEKPHAFIGNEPTYRINPDIRRRVEPLAAGTFAPPFETPQGFVLAGRGRYLRSVVRQIVVMHVASEGRPLHVRQTREAARNTALQALQSLAGDTSAWDRVLAESTDGDLRERPRGNMGPIGNGDLPPALEDALLDTTPGEIHERVIETRVGFHILWRVN